MNLVYLKKRSLIGSSPKTASSKSLNEQKIMAISLTPILKVEKID